VIFFFIPRGIPVLHLTSLTLRNFRNLEAIQWRPAPGLNLIWGENGQGKTNLLEGIHVALTGRSFRTHRDEDCVPWGRSDDPARPTLAQVSLANRHGERRLRVLLGRAWKRVFADEQWLPRLADLWGEAGVVTFTPEDAALLKGPPAGRRRFLDLTISQFSRAYLGDLVRYNQALRQLNAVYKTWPPERDVRETARAWYPELARAGAALMLARARRLREAAGPVRERFTALGGAGALELAYDPDLAFDGLDLADPALEPQAAADAYLARLEASYDDGRRLGLCQLGVHRDDFAVRLEGADLRRFGSQGQHRLAVLTLKLESARWIADALGEPPILLLDDFGSELDPGRREAVLRGLKGAMQVLVTATHPRDLGPEDIFDAHCQVTGGAIVIP
jgi:DNA replication and repair protein RecF